MKYQNVINLNVSHVMREDKIKDKHLFTIRERRKTMELLEKILDNQNLFKAYEQVYANKGSE